MPLDFNRNGPRAVYQLGTLVLMRDAKKQKGIDLMDYQERKAAATELFNRNINYISQFKLKCRSTPFKTIKYDEIEGDPEKLQYVYVETAEKAPSVYLAGSIEWYGWLGFHTVLELDPGYTVLDLDPGQIVMNRNYKFKVRDFWLRNTSNYGAGRSFEVFWNLYNQGLDVGSLVKTENGIIEKDGQ